MERKILFDGRIANWALARPNAIVTVVALYDGPQTLPLPDMYGKNLTFKTGGVDGCHCDETLALIAEGKLDTTPLITLYYRKLNFFQKAGIKGCNLPQVMLC